MSAIRDYLAAKSQLPPKEWLRREPRETHPEILAAVREAIPAVVSPGGTSYDDDVERWVNEHAGDLPPHERHGADRDPLIAQLGHEVYLARGIIRDEEGAATERAHAEDGYVPLADVELEEGARYDVRPGVLYSGYAVPTYGKSRPARAVRASSGGWAFLPKGARTRGFHAVAPMLVRKID